ncbi:MAG: threonine/serine exporter family protein, partial [Muribaculaceae bacterium]|nr:threonine/serine exporter family protein [Muribaculaceae bacterium]
TRLSQLSWETVDSRLSMEECSQRFDRIVHSDGSSHSRTAELLLASAANAAFCRLFGGDAIAMAVVLVATMAGYYIKQLMLTRHIDLRLTVLVCAFISSVISAADSLFALGSTPAIAIGTSVLYLVPGIPFLNSFSDLLYRHYICAFSRFTDAVVLTCCLSAGLCAGMLAMNSGMF